MTDRDGEGVGRSVTKSVKYTIEMFWILEHEELRKDMNAVDLHWYAVNTTNESARCCKRIDRRDMWRPAVGVTKPQRRSGGSEWTKPGLAVDKLTCTQQGSAGAARSGVVGTSVACRFRVGGAGIFVLGKGEGEDAVTDLWGDR